MSVYRDYSLASLLALAVPVAAQPVRSSRVAVDPVTAREAICDLPAERHVRNILGHNGTGCCVWASGQMAADWHDFKPWANILADKLGGAHSGSVDAQMKKKAPGFRAYVQATGRDSIDLCDWCARTGRIACVTYGAAHMVILVHLDAASASNPRACVIDNNRPGEWLWMSRADFLARHQQGGAWSYALILPPPPPVPIAPKE